MNAMTTASAESETAQERKAPGRPRNHQADEAITDAVFALLASGMSAASLSIEAVAAKAGVGKATIYRRWPNKEALLIDAVRKFKGPLPVPKGNSVREDLIIIVEANWTARARKVGKVTACLIPDLNRDEELRQMYQTVMEPRRDVMRQVFRRGVATGELRADLDVELAMLMLSGPSMVQHMLGWNPNVPEEGFAERLVDALLLGFAAPG